MVVPTRGVVSPCLSLAGRHRLVHWVFGVPCWIQLPGVVVLSNSYLIGCLTLCWLCIFTICFPLWGDCYLNIGTGLDKIRLPFNWTLLKPTWCVSKNFLIIDELRITDSLMKNSRSFLSTTTPYSLVKYMSLSRIVVIIINFFNGPFMTLTTTIPRSLGWLQIL